MSANTYDLDAIEKFALAFLRAGGQRAMVALPDLLAMCADIRRYEKALGQIEVHVDPNCETCMATEKPVQRALAGDSDGATATAKPEPDAEGKA